MRTTNPTKLASLGRAAAAITFTRNSNRRSRHATAGKQAREDNHLALLRSYILTCLVCLVSLGVAATPAMAEGFGLERFAIGAQNENGTPDVQAGSHPYSLTTTFVLNLPSVGESYLKDARVQLPPGFVGNPNATPRCTYQEFINISQQEGGGCSNEAAIGVETTYFDSGPGSSELTPVTDPMFNLVPPPGVAAEFGFIVAKNTPVLLQSSVRTGGDYGLTTGAPNINQALMVAASKVTIWGVPSAPSHNPTRGTCEGLVSGSPFPAEEPGRGLGEDEAGLESPVHKKGGPGYNKYFDQGLPGSLGECTTQAPQLPLLTNPTSCGEPRTATFEVDSWEQPGLFRSKEASLPALTGCEKEDFSPTIAVTPDGTAGSTPTGLNVGVELPQEAASLNPNGLTEADVKDTTVALPAGVQLDPSAADGLQACTGDPSDLGSGELGSPDDQIGFKGLNLETGRQEFTSAQAGSVPAVQAVSAHELLASEKTLDPGENFCPTASKIAKVTIKTPLLEGELEGAVYLAAPQNFLGGPLENPFKSLVAMYLVAEEPVHGVLVKLPAKVQLCENTGETIAGKRCASAGQIVTTFENTPQLPFSDLQLEFYGTDRAPLATPAQCGTYNTETSFTSWDGETTSPSSEFSIDSAPNASSCTYPGQALPFSPSLSSGTPNNNAGAFSDLTTTLNREDGQQHIQQVTLHYPAGLSGILSGVELCGEAQANAGTCGPGSEIGETIVSVGLGDDPFTVTGGKVYLTGPYDGAPFGLSIENPAKAGPFDLQEGRPVVVRAKIEVNPITAALTVTTDASGEHAIPTIIDGIPLQIKHVNVNITRPGFTFNPTSCNKAEVTGSVSSAEGATSPVSIPFQVASCEHLKFEPKVSVSTQGHTSKVDGASLTYKIAYPNVPQGTDADIHYVKVELPGELPSRLTTLQKACIQGTFQANPAGCPKESVIGHAKAVVPNIPVPLEGPVYFVSNGGEAFPNLVMVLQGYGVTIELVGDTLIRNGVTSTTFKTVPDNPVTSFEINLPEGKFSALAANGNLCKPTVAKTVKKKVRVQVKGRMRTVTRKVKEQVATSLTIPSDYIAQNGATYNYRAPVAVTGCAKAKVVKKAKKKTKGKRK
jgi:hypothetical protein